MERALLLASPGPCLQHPALLLGPAEGQPLSSRLFVPSQAMAASLSQHWLRCRRSQPTRWVGGVLEKWGRDSSCGAVGKLGSGQNSVEASPGSSCSGRGGAPAACGPLERWCPATAGNSAAGDIWKHRAQLQGAFPHLHVQGPWAGRALQALRTAAHPNHGVGKRLTGNPWGSWVAGCPVSYFVQL